MHTNKQALGALCDGAYQFFQHFGFRSCLSFLSLFYRSSCCCCFFIEVGLFMHGQLSEIASTFQFHQHRLYDTADDIFFNQCFRCYGFCQFSCALRELVYSALLLLPLQFLRKADNSRKEQKRTETNRKRQKRTKRKEKRKGKERERQKSTEKDKKDTKKGKKK